jgi:hypothetical protein
MTANEARMKLSTLKITDAIPYAAWNGWCKSKNLDPVNLSTWPDELVLVAYELVIKLIERLEKSRRRATEFMEQQRRI